METIEFNATLTTIKDWYIVLLPENASLKLPSRGMVMAEVYYDVFTQTLPLEPDGRGSHWLRVDQAFSDQLGSLTCKSFTLRLLPCKTWPEPDLPDDFFKAIKAHVLQNRWAELTSKAQWAWLRWIRSTSSSETRQKRIDTACSMLESGGKETMLFQCESLH